MITVLLNPAAGERQAEDMPSRLIALFNRAGSPAHIVTTTSPADVAEAVRTAVGARADTIVAAGGDGTVNRVVQGLVGSASTLGVLPLGTLNHFAKDLGIPLVLERAVDVIVTGHAIRVDAAQVSEQVFVNNSSIGIYPDIVAERETIRQQGYRKWTAFAIATARILRQHPRMTVRIKVGSSMKTFRTPFLLVGNNEYTVEGIRLGARDRLDGGQLFAYLAPHQRGQDLPKLVALALLSRAMKNRALERFAAVQLEVEAPTFHQLRVALDGELILMKTPLRYRTLPRALNVIVPTTR